MKHTLVITQQPTRTGSGVVPDGAICGNGDLAAVLGDSGSGVRVWLGKSDLWCASADAGEGGVRPLAYIDIDVPAALYRSYRAEQRMDAAQVACIFRNGYSCIEAEITVPATRNAALIRVKWSDNFTCPAVRLTVSQASGGAATPFAAGDIAGARTDYAGDDYAFSAHAVTAIRKIASGEGFADYLVAVATQNDGADYIAPTVEFLKSADEAVAARLIAENKEYWERFWSASGVSLSDESLENDWYASLYLLAVTRGRKDFPAGLFGNLVTADTLPFGGAYALGGRYEAPYFGAASSNHPELTDHYLDPLLAAMPAGRENAKQLLNCGGVFYPAYIGPEGYAPELEGLTEAQRFFGQKIYASYAACVPVMRLNKTLDAEYAATLLPYVSALAEFWLGYMKNEKGLLTVAGDAPRPIPYNEPKFKEKKYKSERRARNSTVSLGAARMVFSAMLTLAALLPDAAIDAAQYEGALAAVSPYPRKGGKFIPAKKGLNKAKKSAVALAPIFPFEQMVFDKKNGKTSRKTAEKAHAWYAKKDEAAAYTAAVRSGVKAEDVLAHYEKNKAGAGLPNGLYDLPDGAQQNIGLAASMLNEMMLRSDGSVLSVFPNWPAGVDCEFRSLRADNAFLVDAATIGGIVRYVRVRSEKGAPLTVRNPFTGKYYGGCVVRVGGEERTEADPFIELELPAGGEAELTPANEAVSGLTRKAVKAAKKSAKKIAKAEKKNAKKAPKRDKKAAKTAAFFSKVEEKADKKESKKLAKKDKKENRKYAKLDQKTAKYRAKQAKKKSKAKGKKKK